jgi:hypothetical protein
VFRATVVEIGASTMPEVPTASTTIVVKVTELFRAPHVLHLLGGQTITVLTAGTDDLEVGQELVFAGRGALYGQSLAVVEQKRVVGPVDSGDLARRVRGEVEAARDRALLERIARASVIVAGTVSASEALPRDPLTEGEHAPQWAEATIEVDFVAKGIPGTRRVAVLYARSSDIRWYRSPKLEVGQEGVWLLSDEPIAGLGRTGLTALSPLDFHTLGALNQIEALARELY